MIWITDLYSSIIQYKYFTIQNGMLFLGVAILLFYYLFNSEKPYSFREELAVESIYMLVFMAYMLSFGTIVSINKQAHLSQLLTSLEYLFILIVVSSLIKGSGTEAFHLLLFSRAIILAIVFLLKPVYVGGGRYAISLDMNSNGLGMSFAAGIWGILYEQQKRRLPFLFTMAFIALFGYCILQTGSRKSLIAAGLIIFLWLIFCFFPTLKEKGGIQGFISFAIMVTLILFIGMAFLSEYSNSTMSNRMEQLQYETSEGNRSQMYRAGLDMIKNSPLFGIGFQGFKQLYGHYSHATIIEIPVSGGIIGTIIYFYVYFVSIKRTILAFKTTRGTSEFIREHNTIKMIIILWVVILFYTICIIHPYQYGSHVLLGIIFGEVSYIEKKTEVLRIDTTSITTESRYIKA